MKTLSITLYNRPEYTQTLLQYLNTCYGLEDYGIFIYCEPNNEKVIEQARNFRPNQTVLQINNYKYGCNKNIFHAIDNAFIESDFHIHLEDDTIPAKDFLYYCEWCNLEYADSDDIFSVSGYVNSNNRIEQYIAQNTRYNHVGIRNWFTPWGWATWKNRWLSVREYIIPFLQTSTASWDYILHNLIRDKKECFPMVSRIQNIGAENGSYCPSAEWHSINQYNEYWIETSKEYQKSFVCEENT